MIVQCQRCALEIESVRGTRKWCERCKRRVAYEKWASKRDKDRPVARQVTCVDCGVQFSRSGNSSRIKRCPGDQEIFDRERRRMRDRRRRFTRHGGFTPEGFEQLLAEQGGSCAICRGDIADVRGRRGMIDHDHACCSGDYGCPRCIRGILCTRCNQGVGYFGDDVARLRSVLTYLLARKPGAASD